MAIDINPRFERPAPIKRPLSWHIRNGIYIYPVALVFVFICLFACYSLITGLPDFPTRNYIDARVDLFLKVGSFYRQSQAAAYSEAVNQTFRLPEIFKTSLFVSFLLVSALVFYVRKAEQKMVIHKGQKLDTQALISELKRSQKP